MYKFFGYFNDVEPHNKSIQSDLALGKYWITQCGWIRLCKIVSTGMAITIFWNIFFYGFKRHHY